ncbi:MAG: hypothetical protein PUC52_04180 [bacterium]|nr:hypothetical protein [bacterium]
MNKHKRHYCALGSIVALELLFFIWCPLNYVRIWIMVAVNLISYKLYILIKGYHLVPFFQKNYPELYEKYSDVRFELTAAGFASVLSNAGEKMDDTLKAEAWEIRITYFMMIVMVLFWIMLLPSRG